MEYLVTFTSANNPWKNVMYVEKEERVLNKDETPIKHNAWMTWEAGLAIQEEMQGTSFTVVEIEQRPRD